MARSKPSGYPSGRPYRRILTGVVVVSALILAWTIVSSVERDRGSELPLDLVQSSAASPSVRVDAASESVAKGGDALDWHAVARAMREVLVKDPLNERALALYALSLEAEGQVSAATKAMSQASGRSLRDPLPHLWLYSHLVRKGEFGLALNHADVVLRAQGQLTQKIFGSFRELIRHPVAADALADQLAYGPPWRTRFLAWIAGDQDSMVEAVELTAKLQQGPRPPTNDELVPLLERLVAAGEYEQALFLWLRGLPNDKFANMDYLMNGDFRFPITGLPFDWSITPIAGADISINNTAGAEDALHVQFYRGRVPFRNVKKLLVLPPGRYQLRGREMAENLDAKRGMVWKLYCADSSAKPLGQSDALKGTTEWRYFEVLFEVPPSKGCEAQWLRLELDARVALEQDVGAGGVWYDDLRITRLDESAAH
ncbi:hypothetical protein [Amorphus sp. MBR-141]